MCSSVLLRFLHFFAFISVADISGWTQVLGQSSSVPATGFIRSEFAGKSHKYCHWEMQRCAHSGQCRVGSSRGWHRTTRLQSCSQPPTKGLNPSRQWAWRSSPKADISFYEVPLGFQHYKWKSGGAWYLLLIPGDRPLTQNRNSLADGRLDQDPLQSAS